jgi:subtilisin family serine protease
MGVTGDTGRWKSEMKTNSYTTALDECIASGVIFVGAAGNSNQKQVGSSHPDWENRVSVTAEETMAQTSWEEFGLETTGSTNRRGFPQQGGMFNNELNERIYPVINIGALDDDFNGTKESKVDYSDRGEEIDVYAPADGTLAANHTYESVGNRPDTYPGFTFNGGVATDCTFGGTSAACPVATGLIATVLEHNRSWGWQEVKTWLESLDTQADSLFYFGTESTTATSANWFDYESLEGGSARVLYQGNINISNIPFRKLIKGSFRIKGNLMLRFRQ